jgi:hypothetical protein
MRFVLRIFSVHLFDLIRFCRSGYVDLIWIVHFQIDVASDFSVVDSVGWQHHDRYASSGSVPRCARYRQRQSVGSVRELRGRW